MNVYKTWQDGSTKGYLWSLLINSSTPMDPIWENLGPSGSIFENFLSPIFFV